MELTPVYPKVLPEVLPAVAPSSGGGQVDPPVRTAAASIAADGAFGEGTTLTATPGTWENADDVTGKWQLGPFVNDSTPPVWQDIPGATDLTYVLGATLNHKDRYRYLEIATNAGPTEVTGASNVIQIVKPVNTTAPSLSYSSLLPGSVVTATTGTWTGRGITYSRQWLRNGVAISGETGSTYTLVYADDATSLSCRVTATNAVGATVATTASVALDFPLVNQVSDRAGIALGMSAWLGDAERLQVSDRAGIGLSMHGMKGLARPQAAQAETASLQYRLSGFIEVASGDNAYADLLVSQGASSHWKFDETSGSAAADSINGRNGVLSSTYTRNQGSFVDAAISVLFAPGMFRVNQVASELDTTDMSVSGWFYHDGSATTASLLFALVQQSSLSTYKWSVELTRTSGSLSIRAASTTSTTLSDTSAFSSHRWFHFAVTQSGTTWKAFINGSLAATFTNSKAAVAGPLAFIAGSVAGATPAFRGKVDSIALFPTALSDAQILAQFQTVVPAL